MMMVLRGAIAAVVMMLVAGCGGKAQATSEASGAELTSSSELNSNTDPCAMRMHDICAPLLLYYGRYETLPAQLDELAQVPGVTVPELVCPVSGEQYIYNVHGPAGPEAGTQIILYDAIPVHAGRRWGIAVREPTPGQALVVNVVAAPESVFSRP